MVSITCFYLYEEENISFVFPSTDDLEAEIISQYGLINESQK